MTCSISHRKMSVKTSSKVLSLIYGSLNSRRADTPSPSPSLTAASTGHGTMHITEADAYLHQYSCFKQTLGKLMYLMKRQNGKWTVAPRSYHKQG